MLCYGAMIWGHRAPELAAKLRRVNRMAINTFASFPKSTPTAALEVMLDVMPLHIFCEQEAIAARIRLSKVLEFGWSGRNSNKTHSTSHMKRWNDRLKEYELKVSDCDSCKERAPENKFSINRDSFDGKAKHRQLTQMNVFTDGSKMEGNCGAGYTLQSKGREIACAEFLHGLPGRGPGRGRGGSSRAGDGIALSKIREDFYRLTGGDLCAWGRDRH